MKAPRESPARLVAGLAFVLVSFSLNSLITRILVRDNLLDPGLVTDVRFLAGAVALVIILAARGQTRDAVPRRRDALPALALGAYAYLISYGYAATGAAAGTLAFYALVLLTMTLGGALRVRRLPAPRIVTGGLLALTGIATLSLGRIHDATPRGILLLALTGAAWGAYSLLGQARRDAALAHTTRSFTTLGLALLPHLAYSVATRAHWTPTGLLLAAIMGAATTALAYAAWTTLLPRLAPAQAGAYQLAIPILTALLAILWLGETASPALGIAALLVLAGMALATPRREPAPPSTTPEAEPAND